MADITQKTKDCTIRTPVKNGDALRCSENVSLYFVFSYFVGHIKIQFL